MVYIQKKTGPRGTRGKMTRTPRAPRTPRFTLPADAKINYKDVPLLQKYLTERGKIVPRRLSGLTAIQQRTMSLAIKWARYLAILPSGASKRR